MSKHIQKETFSKINEDLDRELTEQRKAERQRVVSANGSCLTCKYTESQSGIFLICSLKNKKVREYNYCEKWRSPLGDTTSKETES